MSRKNDEGMNHLLLTDENNLMLSIQHDFPELARVISIGKSYEGRDINVLEINVKKTEAAKAPLEEGLVQFPVDLEHV